MRKDIKHDLSHKSHENKMFGNLFGSNSVRALHLESTLDARAIKRPWVKGGGQTWRTMHSANLVTKSTLSSILAESLCSAALKAAPTSDSLLFLVRFHSVPPQLLSPPVQSRADRHIWFKGSILYLFRRTLQFWGPWREVKLGYAFITFWERRQSWGKIDHPFCSSCSLFALEQGS